MKIRNKIAASALWLAMLGSVAAAQNGHTSLGVSSTAIANKQNYILTVSGSHERGKDSLSGFLDIYGRGINDYGELYYRRSLKGPDMQAELNGGNGVPPIFRTGMILDLMKKERIYTNVKILPLNISTKSGLLPEMQIGPYVSANLGKGFSLESWLDFTFDYDGSKSSVLTTTTLKRNIGKKWHLQGIASRNVYSGGWDFGIGIGYNIK